MIRRSALRQAPESAVGRPVREAVSALGRRPRDDVARSWVARLESRRAELLRSEQRVRLGESESTVAEVCARTSKEPAFCLFLFELVRRVAPSSVVEMGTSVGVSGSYIAAALRESPGGALVTLDALADGLHLACRDLEALGLGPVRGVVGTFDETLRPTLADIGEVDFLFIDGHHQEQPTLDYFATALEFLSPQATVVFDDIRWSEGMRRAWSEVSRHPRVDFAVDLGLMGIVRLKQRAAG